LMEKVAQQRIFSEKQRSGRSFIMRAAEEDMLEASGGHKKREAIFHASLLMLSIRLDYQLNGIEPIVKVPSASSLT